MIRRPTLLWCSLVYLAASSWSSAAAFRPAATNANGIGRSPRGINTGGGGGSPRAFLYGRTAVLRRSSPSAEQRGDEPSEEEKALVDSAVQWELLKKHHARGSWRGVWTTYDYMGDVQDEAVGAVVLDPEGGGGDDDGISIVRHEQQIVMGAKRSDCDTCFDAMDVKTMPIATLTPDNVLQKRMRLGACGMINGPTVLRNGAMATELVLSFGDGRVRVVFQHAPVWERGNEQQVGPPAALKLFRCMVSRETLRGAPPTAESESERVRQFLDGTFDAEKDPNPLFFRPVKPFDWHKVWSGTSWTWGPNTGNRGWSINSVEDGDSWHGNAPVEVWNLRLPDGIFLQAPRLVSDAGVELFRLAWLPNSQNLIRLEGGVLALQPLALDDADAEVVGFAPPSLVSLRCDVFQKVADLEGEPQFVRAFKPEQQQQQQQQEVSPWESIFNPDGSPKAGIAASAEGESSGPVQKDPVAEQPQASDPGPKELKKKEETSPSKNDDDLKAIQDVLKL